MRCIRIAYTNHLISLAKPNFRSLALGQPVVFKTARLTTKLLPCHFSHVILSTIYANFVKRTWLRSYAMRNILHRGHLPIPGEVVLRGGYPFGTVAPIGAGGPDNCNVAIRSLTILSTSACVN